MVATSALIMSKVLDQRINQKEILSHEEQIHRKAHDLAQQAKKLKSVSYIPLPHNNL